MSEETKNTEGGAAVEGDVQAGRDFVGRDQIVHDDEVHGDKVAGDKITVNITWPAAPFSLEQEPDLAQLREDYLAYLRQAYQYLDFKGLPQVEKIAQQLPLDAVYVRLRARPEMPEGETWLRVAGRLWKEQGLAGEEIEAEGHLPPQEERALAAQPVPADQALGQAPALVILGDPGAGKSTLLKVLTLSLARQEEGPLPILVPLNAYAAALENGEISLHAFLPRYFASRQHRLANLAPLFDAALKAGQAVVLLDGLDEVQAKRPFLARLVQDFAAECVPQPEPGEKPVPGNRLAVTSRIVGYREAPLRGPGWRTYTLVDFGREEIERFAGRWTLAFEVAVHGNTGPARQAARRERDDLLASISASPGIERLASNPLLLTILALIKRQGVSLPRRRVELYELYLRTLINAWNQARSLDQRPVGPELDYLETVQVLAPLGLWLRETNPTAGLVSRADLERWLAAYYRDEWGMAPGPARGEAREFLNAVRRYSNLLVERGVDQYGFLHLTFEEMLAGKGIAAQAQLGPAGAVNTILRHLEDPNWRETILLALGALGIVAQQPRAAGEVLRHLCQAELQGEARDQNIIIAGEALLDVGEVGVGRRAASQVTQQLVHTMQDAGVPARTRREAGLVLGRLGWQPDDLDAFVEIPPGPFLYGDHQERREIAHGYWMARYPVTNAQYARFVEGNGYGRPELWGEEGWSWRRRGERDAPSRWDDTGWNNPIFPVIGVTWFEAEAYCNWLTEQFRVTGSEFRVWHDGRLETRNWEPEGMVVRLPTEEEWERAARGTDGPEYPWGENFEVWRANTSENKISNTTAVCTYPGGVGPEAVWDTSGNVWEWTVSRWEPGDDRRVLRGGSWLLSYPGARCASRYGYFPVFFFDLVGFRLVVSLALPASGS